MNSAQSHGPRQSGSSFGTCRLTYFSPMCARARRNRSAPVAMSRPLRRSAQQFMFRLRLSENLFASTGGLSVLRFDHDPLALMFKAFATFRRVISVLYGEECQNSCGMAAGRSYRLTRLKAYSLHALFLVPDGVLTTIGILEDADVQSSHSQLSSIPIPQREGPSREFKLPAHSLQYRWARTTALMVSLRQIGTATHPLKRSAFETFPGDLQHLKKTIALKLVIGGKAAPGRGKMDENLSH